MKAWIGFVLVVGAIVGLVTHNNPWASLGMAVLGGVLIDADDVTGLVKVVAPYIPGSIGRRLSGSVPPPPPDAGRQP